VEAPATESSVCSGDSSKMRIPPNSAAPDCSMTLISRLPSRTHGAAAAREN